MGGAQAGRHAGLRMGGLELGLVPGHPPPATWPRFRPHSFLGYAPVILLGQVRGTIGDGRAFPGTRA